MTCCSLLSDSRQICDEGSDTRLESAEGEEGAEKKKDHKPQHAMLMPQQMRFPRWCTICDSSNRKGRVSYKPSINITTPASVKPHLNRNAVGLGSGCVPCGTLLFFVFHTSQLSPAVAPTRLGLRLQRRDMQK